MSLHTRPVVPLVRPPSPLNRGMTVVVVTRTAIGRDGWPQSWKQLRERAESEVHQVLQSGGNADGSDYHLRQMTLGELTFAAYQSLDRAFFRECGDDRACLVAQAWTA